MKKSEQQAPIDAVEKEIINGPKQSKETGASSTSSVEPKFFKKIIQQVTQSIQWILNHLKTIDYQKFWERIKPNESQKETLKRFASSNTGIVVIGIFVAVVVVGGIALKHHHHRKIPDVTTHSVTWDSQDQTTDQMDFGSKNIKPIASVSQDQIQEINQRLDAVESQLKATNQRLLVVADSINRVKKNQHHQSYQVLGWTLDNNTNQYIVDIEYQGQLRSYYSGQSFGVWTIESIDPTRGPVIKKTKRSA